MIVELVTFKGPPGADWDDTLKDARAVIPRLRANPDLLRKHFLLSDDGEECGGLSIWPTHEAAEAAHNAAWCASVEKRTGAPPTIRYFQLQILLDNEAGTVTEWSKNRRKRSTLRVRGRLNTGESFSGPSETIARRRTVILLQSAREQAALRLI